MSDAQVWLGKLAPKDAERDATLVRYVTDLALRAPWKRKAAQAADSAGQT